MNIAKKYRVLVPRIFTDEREGDTITLWNCSGGVVRLCGGVYEEVRE